MKVAVLGRTQILYAAIKALTDAGHDIVVIGTSPASPEYLLKESAFEKLAKDMHCPFFCDTNLEKPEIQSLLRSCNADIAISLNWLTLIRQNVISLFRYGILNAHAGDLPRYRGNACPNWAILNGEAEVVLTIHQMTEDLDAGPVLIKRPFPLSEKTYIGDIYQFMESNVPEIFVEAINGLATGTLVPKAQPADPVFSLRCYPRIPEDSEISWDTSAESIARLVRASAEPFAGAYTFLNSSKLIVWRAYHTNISSPSIGVPGQVIRVRKESGEVEVFTANGVLVLQELQLNDTQRKKAADVLTSTRFRLGFSATDEINSLKAQLTALEKKVALSERKNDC